MTYELSSLDQFRVAKEPTQVKEPAPSAQVPFRYIKGPIPWAWTVAACKLPGKATQLALALVHQAGLEKKKTFHLQPSLVRQVGLSRSGYYAAMKAMQQAGLIAVRGAPGRAPTVTLLGYDVGPWGSNHG